MREVDGLRGPHVVVELVWSVHGADGHARVGGGAPVVHGAGVERDRGVEARRGGPVIVPTSARVKTGRGLLDPLEIRSRGRSTAGRAWGSTWGAGTRPRGTGSSRRGDVVPGLGGLDRGGDPGDPADHQDAPVAR